MDSLNIVRDEYLGIQLILLISDGMHQILKKSQKKHSTDLFFHQRKASGQIRRSDGASASFWPLSPHRAPSDRPSWIFSARVAPSEDCSPAQGPVPSSELRQKRPG